MVAGLNRADALAKLRQHFVDVGLPVRSLACAGPVIWIALACATVPAARLRISLSTDA
jgi:hypothetical protein